MPEFDLFAGGRGSVTAPAGCGKTQLIADTLACHRETKPILVLTHTNAGISALRARLQRARVPSSAYKLTTIDGFARALVRTFPLRSGLSREVLKIENPKTDYVEIRIAAGLLLATGNINEILAASYSRMIVDEYQDCSLSQHAIVDHAADVLPTCVLGDPMQAIFGFGGNQLVDWDLDVLPQFPTVGVLQTPWRWRNANTEFLGHWLLACRDTLLGDGAIDLRRAPSEVGWVRLNPASAHFERSRAARTAPPFKDDTVLIIGDSLKASGRRRIASQTPGAINVEPADLADLADFALGFEIGAPDAVAQLVSFAGEVMTNVGASELQRRVVSLRQGTARKPPNPSEDAVVHFANEPSLVTALEALLHIKAAPGVRVYRPEILRSCLAAMHAAKDGTYTFREAAERERDRCRHLGRAIARRSVGSTLLLKGLEADVAVLLHPEQMNAKHLYVALTRGAKRVVVCSTNPVLAPSAQTTRKN